MSATHRKVTVSAVVKPLSAAPRVAGSMFVIATSTQETFIVCDNLKQKESFTNSHWARVVDYDPFLPKRRGLYPRQWEHYDPIVKLQEKTGLLQVLTLVTISRHYK